MDEVAKKNEHRLTYRSEITICASSKEEAMEIFENMPVEQLRKDSSFVEVFSLE